MMQESKLTNFQQRQLSANMKGLSLFLFSIFLFCARMYVCMFVRVCVCVWIPLRVFRQLGIGWRKLGVNVNKRIRPMAERSDTSSFSSFVILAFKGMVSHVRHYCPKIAKDCLKQLFWKYRKIFTKTFILEKKKAAAVLKTFPNIFWNFRYSLANMEMPAYDCYPFLIFEKSNLQYASCPAI